MKLKLHYSLLIIFLVFLYGGLFVEFFILFAVILAHEFGHLLLCIIYKQKIDKINVTLIGGKIDVDINKLSFLKELSVYVAGVGVNLLLLFLSRYIRNGYYQIIIYNYNFLLIAFNLLPIYPLDGYKILEVLFSLIKDPFKEQRLLSLISGVALFFLSLYLFTVSSLAFWIINLYLIIQNFYLSSFKNEICLRKIIKRYRYN